MIKLKIVLVILFLLALNNSMAQSRSWTTEISDDGLTSVQYNIYDSLDVEGDEVTYIEYNATTKTKATLENCIEIFNNPDMHKKFYEYTEESKKIKTISESAWIVYYYYSPPWPIADSDCVSRITMISDSLKGKVVFTSFSEPNLIEKKDVVRSELNNITFTFKQISDSEVEITIEAILIPEMAAPKWMMNAWFPDGPAGTLKRFKELAENSK